MLLFKLIFPFLFFILHSCKSKNPPPNVIIFFTDDQGYADVGCYGGEGIKTPNFDQMAKDGVRFTNFYAPATVSTPSRAGLLTGQYPKRSDLHEAVIFPYSTNGLSPSKYTIADMFKENGYSTACLGKWHLGHLPEFMPNNHGFDYFYGVPYSNDMDNYYYENIDYQSPPLPFYKNDEIIKDALEGFTTYRENAGFAIDASGRISILKKPTDGWQTVNAHSVLTSGPLLVYDGEQIEQVDAKFNTNRHPRTTVGVTEKNHLLAVVIDGRNSQAHGMTTEELSILMQSLGCKEAMNLDGGGSSTAWVKNRAW